MRDSIIGFAKQFKFVPKIENSEKLLTSYSSYRVCGMGGSHLSADILRSWHPEIPLRVYSDYGLPLASKDTLLIFSSYSGNTEEVLDGLNSALAGGLNCAVIATGGKLLDLAKHNNLPFVQLPPEGIQPRMALGHSLRALLSILGEEELLKETDELTKALASQGTTLRGWEAQGEELAGMLNDKVTVIYGSRANEAIAKSWKIKFNETAKVPAFYNVLPEANHNEMEGFDLNDKSTSLSKNIYAILLHDSEDHPQIQKRMEVMEKLLKDRGLGIHKLSMTGASRIERIFNSLLLADWTSFYLAKYYGVDPEDVPLVEEFKELIK